MGELENIEVRQQAVADGLVGIATAVQELFDLVRTGDGISSAAAERINAGLKAIEEAAASILVDDPAEPTE